MTEDLRKFEVPSLIILQGLRPGPHKVLIKLEDANHHTLDKGMVTFVIPEKFAAEKHH